MNNITKFILGLVWAGITAFLAYHFYLKLAEFLPVFYNTFVGGVVWLGTFLFFIFAGMYPLSRMFEPAFFKNTNLGKVLTMALIFSSGASISYSYKIARGQELEKYGESTAATLTEKFRKRKQETWYLNITAVAPVEGEETEFEFQIREEGNKDLEIGDRIDVLYSSRQPYVCRALNKR